MLIEPKTFENWRDTMLAKFKELLPNANILEDSMIFMDASTMAEAFFMLQQDAITLANNSFIAYATGDELTNLGIDRGIEREPASYATGIAKVGRDSFAIAENFTLPIGTLLSTTSSTDTEVGVVFQTTEEVTLYGQLPTPSTPSVIVLASGGSLGTGYYNFRIAGVSGDGSETDAGASTQIQITSGTTNAISVSWTAVSAAESYKIYYASGSTPGSYYLLGNSSGPLYVMTNTTVTSELAKEVNSTGQLYVEVAIKASQSGLYGNVGVSSIDEFITKPLGFDWVTNDAETSGGQEEEDDETFRERLRTTLRTNSSKVTATGYKLSVESIPGVRSATVSIPTGGAYRNEILITVVAENSSGIPSPALLTTVEEFINSDDNRAVCDNITVAGPSITNINYAVTILEYKSDIYTTTQVTTQIHDAIDTYLKSVETGGKVYKKGIENAINDLDSVIDFTLTTPTTNTTLSAGHIAAIGTESVTF